ncbi:hypothetical protein GGI25_005255 [Coemansia spiralis]|uniref:Uncharacterized protein n=2 Tax=Coemansia TaxID=4863 RepID=A0A9W8FYY5_9FUNG|nr:hypothetical protein BX070DRAFT_250357 [Coemansia spiralis]KAJ1987012.1 hypothetical protein EDC05_006037 [Coemansia umbellata]KAJ2619020.1 hypothetical protein GGI26_006176 [Coemansia sp. RSA 1358]KAJ2672061.1 hypothetical protein GGI25_005255 [Coemansia spiralis]
MSAIPHYVVSLFGTGCYDGINASIFILTTPDTATMQKLAVQSKYQRNFFLVPLSLQTNEEAQYVLWCFSRSGKIEVPALFGFAAAHIVIRELKIKTRKVHVTEGNVRTMEFLVTKSGQIQCNLVLGPTVRQNVNDLVRIILTNIFGPNRQTTDVDYIEVCRTLVVYDSMSTKSVLQKLNPRPATYTKMAVDQLRVGTVIVCVKDKTTGGLFARSFLPGQGYAETAMPAFATPYLRNSWAPKSVQTLFEIGWCTMGKSCRVIKSLGSEESKPKLIAKVETISSTMVYV